MEPNKDETEEFKCPAKRKPEPRKEDEFQEPPRKKKAVDPLEKEEEDKESDNSFKFSEDEKESDGSAGSLDPEDDSEGNRITKATR